MKCMRSIKFFGQFALVIILGIQLSGCGTLMYPERRGQRSGQIDAGVAVLDGLGLFLFIIPGVIAYAVDFSTGAIFLPGGHNSSLSGNNLKVVRVHPGELDQTKIDGIVAKETGIPMESLEKDVPKVYTLARTDQISEILTQMKQ